MNLPRQHSRIAYLKLKDASGRLVGRCGGLVKAAGLTRISKSQISECKNTTDMARFLPIDVVADLEAYVGEPIVSRLLSEFAGDPVEVHQPVDRMRRMAECIKETAEAVTEFANGDSQRALKEIREGIQALEAMERDVIARQSRPKLATSRAAE